MRKLAWSMLGIGLLTLAVATALWLDFQHWWRAPLPSAANDYVFDVDAGQGLAAVAQKLAHAGVLDRPRYFVWAARTRDAAVKIQRGEYQIPPASSPEELLRLLQEGRVRVYSVTLPEGIILRQALDILAGAPALQSTLMGVDDPRLLALVSPQESAEGWFFPDTYRYHKGDSDWDVLLIAHRAMRRVLADNWAERSELAAVSTPYEALILASIIERETGLASERPDIGGVFSRRLRLGMRLQTDPTIIYGLGDRYEGRLRREHLRDAENSYNTYRHGGLPPSPIALPGLGAIAAAVRPADGDALYFVARGDGSHEFSVTLEAHEAAVRLYQLNRVDGYRSSPQGRQ
jgi:UPF0755 protein